MTEFYMPKQIADKLQVSTTTLRKYEDLGLIPEVARTSSNRRCYTAVHMQAFITIRALLKGYSVSVAYEMMRKVKQGQSSDALWIMNEQQYNIQLEKMRVESIMRMLESSDFSRLSADPLQNNMSIGEAAAIAGVNSSAIRHWEKSGLIHSERNAENGYRIFSTQQIQKILIISSLRKTIYFIDHMKELLHNFDNQQIADIERSFQLAFQNLHQKLNLQYQAAAQLVSYINQLQEYENS